MSKISIFCIGFVAGIVANIIRGIFKNRSERLGNVEKSIGDIERSEREQTNIVNTIRELTDTDERAITTIEEIIERTERNNKKTEN